MYGGKAKLRDSNWMHSRTAPDGNGCERMNRTEKEKKGIIEKI